MPRDRFWKSLLLRYEGLCWSCKTLAIYKLFISHLPCWILTFCHTLPTMLNLDFLSVSDEIANVTSTHAASARYVLAIALICWCSDPATAELKLGQYSHRNTVPVSQNKCVCARSNLNILAKDGEKTTNGILHCQQSIFGIAQKNASPDDSLNAQTPNGCSLWHKKLHPVGIWALASFDLIFKMWCATVLSDY